MRLAPAALACSLLPAVALADGHAPASADGGPVEVIGGSDAKAGKWPDVAAILFPDASGDEALCTGTLVAPTVVLTAGHCYDELSPPLPDNVLIGASTLANGGDGEVIPIKAGFVYPDPDTTEDLTVLVLAHASTKAPRKIVDGWARLDLTNGAPVSLVGFGAIDANGDQFIDALQEATTTITDFDCSVSPGCNVGAQPDGELGAGGMGVDTCPGDSGGPLYLLASYGAVLGGVTSRSFDNPSFPCSGGGIYVRPDKVLAWIEQMAGVPVSRVGSPAADPISAVHGDGGDTKIAVNDPENSSYSFAVTTPPAHGMANVRSDGAVRVCTDAAAAPGDDQVIVTITDTKNTQRALPITIPIKIEDGTPPKTCDINSFPQGGGCCDAGGHPGAAIPLALGVLGLIRRRRRA